jgi:hypothetical protein
MPLHKLEKRFFARICGRIEGGLRDWRSGFLRNGRTKRMGGEKEDPAIV